MSGLMKHPVVNLIFKERLLRAIVPEPHTILDLRFEILEIVILMTIGVGNLSTVAFLLEAAISIKNYRV